MIPRHMEVANIVKMMNTRAIQEQHRSDRVHRCVSPSLVEEAARLVEPFKVLLVRFASPEAEVACGSTRRDEEHVLACQTEAEQMLTNLEIGPEMAQVPIRTADALFRVVCEEVQPRIFGDVLGILLGKLLRRVPERCDSLAVFVQRHGEAVGLSRNSRG